MNTLANHSRYYFTFWIKPILISRVTSSLKNMFLALAIGRFFCLTIWKFGSRLILWTATSNGIHVISKCNQAKRSTLALRKLTNPNLSSAFKLVPKLNFLSRNLSNKATCSSSFAVDLVASVFLVPENISEPDRIPMTLRPYLLYSEREKALVSVIAIY